MGPMTVFFSFDLTIIIAFLDKKNNQKLYKIMDN